MRVAAASVATGVLTVGSALPVYAAGDGGRHAGHEVSAQHRHSAGRSAPASEHSERRSRDSAGRSSTSSHGTRSHGAGTSPPQAHASPAASKSRAESHRRHDKADPPRHTPVTVCHILGNGSYHLLTMDDSALKAHVGHGDLYPVPEGGCPDDGAAAPEAPTPAPEEQDAEVPAAEVPADGEGTLPQVGLADTVLGVQLERTGQVAATEVASRQTAAVQLTGAPARPGAAVHAAGVLPQTGAGEIALSLAAGLGLLATGAGLLGRRRRLMSGTR